MFATLGVGWISTSHGHRLATVRAQTADAPVGSAYQLLGTSGGQFLPLSMHWWRTVDAISQALFRLESRYLLGLVLYGPDRSPTDLLSVPREALQAGVAALVGPTDVTPFYPS